MVEINTYECVQWARLSLCVCARAHFPFSLSLSIVFFLLPLFVFVFFRRVVLFCIWYFITSC